MRSYHPRGRLRQNSPSPFWVICRSVRSIRACQLRHWKPTLLVSG
ncbi:hypothetical protein [Bradyrhizobium japonicum]